MYFSCCSIFSRRIDHIKSRIYEHQPQHIFAIYINSRAHFTPSWFYQNRLSLAGANFNCKAAAVCRALFPLVFRRRGSRDLNMDKNHAWNECARRPRWCWCVYTTLSLSGARCVWCMRLKLKYAAAADKRARGRRKFSVALNARSSRVGTSAFDLRWRVSAYMHDQ